MAQLTSLVAEGAFQAVPDLRVAIGEIGFAWLPSLMWRLDKEWKGLRRDIPWVTAPPSELIREHVRLTTAPLDMALPGGGAATSAEATVDPAAELAEVVGWLGSEQMLMFATDYPHAHEAPIAALLEQLPETMRGAVMADSARAFYRLGSRR
jgi:predicted TIM-barrel fold metal-dependent hydrolase